MWVVCWKTSGHKKSGHKDLWEVQLPHSGAYFLCFQVCYSVHRLCLMSLLSWISIPSNCEPKYICLPWDVSAGCSGYSNTTGTITGCTVKWDQEWAPVEKELVTGTGWDAGIMTSSLLTSTTSLCDPVKILLFFQENKKENEKIKQISKYF